MAKIAKKDLSSGSTVDEYKPPLKPINNSNTYVDIEKNKKNKKSLDDILEAIKKNNAEINKQDEENENVSRETSDELSLDELKNLFGIGFNEREYREMYKKYVALQNNYPLKTEMHKEALITYVKYAFKRDQAISNDDMDAADKWGKLCAKQATDAKINPSQLSAADLSDGITCFSQLAQAVEKEVDVVPILNEYIERPRDRVDYTIYMIIDYLRDLEGKSHIDYKDVYQYIFKQRDKNAKKWGDKVVPNENKPDPNAILVDGEN